MRMNKYTNASPKYIKAEVEILPGKDYEMFVEDVVEEELSSRDGGTERKPVMYFRGKKKSFPLNKLNSRTLTAYFGSDETEDWKGRKIYLYANWETAFGKEQYCIRVRPRGYEPGADDQAPVDMEEKDVADDDNIPF